VLLHGVLQGTLGLLRATIFQATFKRYKIFQNFLEYFKQTFQLKKFSN
jgi:hypothetical protein